MGLRPQMADATLLSLNSCGPHKLFDVYYVCDVDSARFGLRLVIGSILGKLIVIHHQYHVTIGSSEMINQLVFK